MKFAAARAYLPRVSEHSLLLLLSLLISLPSCHLSSPIALSSLIALFSLIALSSLIALFSLISLTGTLPHPQVVSCCMSTLRACQVPIGVWLAMQRIWQ